MAYSPTPEQIAAHDRLICAYAELHAAGEALLVLMPPTDDHIDDMLDMLRDMRPSEILDELGPGWKASETWNARMEEEEEAPLG